MTYCVALSINEGLVFLADTRTNAGVDNVSKVKKLFTYEVPGERVITMMTAGNLGITQAVLSEIDEQIERVERGESSENTILSVSSMFYVAQLVGDTMRDVQARYGPGLAARGADSGATIIVGGQRKGGKPRLFLIYPEGNFIEATQDTPYFQIGEHKYGKPIIDRVVEPETALEDAVLCALLSMDSTIRSNLSVGMPLDLAVVRAGTYSFAQNRRIEAGDEAFQKFSDLWSQQLRMAFEHMHTLEVRSLLASDTENEGAATLLL